MNFFFLSSFFRSAGALLKRQVSGFTGLNLAATTLILIIRAAQFFILSSRHPLPHGAILLELHGCLHDFIVWQVVSWVVFIPYVLLSSLKRLAGAIFYGLVFLVFIIIEWALFEYFTVMLVPLDEVVFSYSVKEMVMIVRNSVPIGILSFVPFIVLSLAVAGVVFLSLKIRISTPVVTVFLFVSILSIAFRSSLVPKETGKTTGYYISVSKTAYFFDRCMIRLHADRGPVSISQVEAAALRYQEQHSEFRFPGTTYPFLHYDETPDVLGGFFDFKAQKPNLVIVIVESLSSCFSGNNTIYGSFTPFLDSLAGHSLYWPNFLSSSERTFNVIEAVTGSVPPGYDSFVIPSNNARYPYLMSLVSYLEQGGYFTGFYHGGDPCFNYMDDYLIHQKIDYVLRYFGPRYRRLSAAGESGWGYSDADMFNRAFEVIDSLKRSPRLDLYLTVGTHSPFIIPDQPHYISMAEERIRRVPAGYMLSQGDMEKYKKVFSTVLYSDHALREFMKNSQKRPGYDNTIFLITGDHAMPEVTPGRISGLERFHVPLIIYSPMLKKNATFLSVSSHLDIAPTLLAMLNQNFGLEISSVAPWLGSGIDTTSFFRNSHALPFIQNNREILDYIDHLCYLSPFELMEIPPDFRPVPLQNPPVEARLRRELNDVKMLSRYVFEQNKLVPAEVYFGGMLVYDTVRLPAPYPFLPGDSLWEYKAFSEKIPIDPKYKLLKLEVTFEFTVSGRHPERPPRLVMDLCDKSGRRIFYNSFEISRELMSRAGSRTRSRTRFSESMDLSYLKGKEPYQLALYMWNPDRCTFRMIAPRVRILGLR